MIVSLIILYLSLGVVSYFLMKKMFLYCQVSDEYSVGDRMHVLVFSIFWPFSILLFSMFALTEYLEKNHKKPAKW